MQRCWHALTEVYPKLQDASELYKLAQDTTPAMLVYLVQGWYEERRPADIHGYVHGHHIDKLLNEVSVSCSYIALLNMNNKHLFCDSLTDRASATGRSSIVHNRSCKAV